MVFTEANYRSRVKRIQEEMVRRDIDAMVLERPESSYYVTGCNAVIYSRPIYAVVTQDGDPTLVLPYLRELHAKDESWVKDFKAYFEFSVRGRVFPEDSLTALKETLADKAVLKKTIGVEMEYLSAGTFARLERAFPDAKLVDVSALIDAVKCIKDQQEIEVIRAASRLSDIAMDKASEVVGKRGTERDVFEEATLVMLDQWRKKYSHLYIAGLHHESHAFHIGCASGPRNQLHYGGHKPSDQKIQDGDGVTVVFTPTLNCYHGELERTFLVGQPKDKHVRMFKAVLEAREKAFELIKPGTKCFEIDEATRAVFKKHGLAESIRHRSGHSIGVELHEYPLLRIGHVSVIQPNMVFAVEPGLYQEDVGGVRHSDTILVTATGCEFLTRYDRGFLTR